jgi:3-oxoacyl-[acyl-carrier protein] reductase
MKEESSMDDIHGKVALVRETGQRGILVQADVSKSSETAKMIHSVERELGQVQILVNNAGIVIKKPLRNHGTGLGQDACGKP